MKDKPLIVLVGPTASGKTEVGCFLSKLLPSEIISCDSMQVYRSMPIVSQAPAKYLTKKIPIHLVSFLSPQKEYSAALFRQDALALIQKIHKKNKTPILVGGTGLYVRALLDGLFETEEGQHDRSQELRQKLLGEAQTGISLHEKLLSVDPISARRIHPNDHRRLVRALEVFYLTGMPISSKQPERKGIRDTLKMKTFFLERDRQALYERIHLRVDQMLKDGLVEEVKKLRKKKLSVTAKGALGIKEIEAYLEGRCTLEDAVTHLKKNTRNYAKRQMSWFRHEKDIETISVLPLDTPQDIARSIHNTWKKFTS